MFSFRYKNNPTIDIYFASPLKKLISNGWSSNNAKPIRRIGPNCFFANEKIIVFRYVTKSELSLIRELSPKKVFYVIDDDLKAVKTDISLPKSYKKKLTEFITSPLPELLNLTDVIISPNQRILNSYPSKPGIKLDPSYTSICEKFSHFHNPPKIKVLFSGSRSHLCDLDFLKESLLNICRRNPDVELTTFFGKHVPEILSDMKNIKNRHPLPWKSYKKVLQKEHFHIALASYKSTNFNNGRSINKIFDHAAFGAAGLYSQNSPLNQVITDGENGFLLPENSQAWEHKLEDLINDLGTAEKMAKNGALLAKTIGDPAKIKKFWVEILFR